MTVLGAVDATEKSQFVLGHVSATAHTRKVVAEDCRMSNSGHQLAPGGTERGPASLIRVSMRGTRLARSISQISVRCTGASPGICEGLP